MVVTEDFGSLFRQIYRSKGYDIFNDNLKFVILVNEGSASASEILAGALREYGKLLLLVPELLARFGSRTLPITSDTSLKVTVAHWLTPLGNSISKVG